MHRIAVVTDSTANLPADWAHVHSVQIVPLSINFDGEVYRDGVDIDNATFYRKLRRSATLPTTSQPPVGDFLDVYRRLSVDHEHVVSIHIAAGLSSTVSSARAAAAQLRLQDAGAAEVHVVDSQATSAVQVLLVTAALRAIAEGRDAREVIDGLEAIVPRTRNAFIPVTLEYLRRGGRIGAAAALAGSLLQIRPVLEIRNGHTEMREKVRTTARARRRLVDLLADGHEGVPVHVVVIHADAPEEGQELGEEMGQRLDCRELMVVEFSAVLGTHGGPGALGAALYPDV